MQVNMGSRVNDMQMYNTFSVNQWSTFRRSFSLRLLKLLTATYCSVPTAISSFYFWVFFLISFCFFTKETAINMILHYM